jgi:CelD/BcsL family acetyltransferase involved in cellulose biosynthesis
MKKFEFELSDEATENILSIIRDQINDFRHTKVLEFLDSEPLKEWFRKAADALEEDFNIILKGMKNA